MSHETLLGLLGQSAGSFLRLIEVEPMIADTFVGWRLTRLPEATPPWLDLRVGDVVTRINGLPVERPEHAQRIWEEARVASEIRIDYLRGEESRSTSVSVRGQ